MSSNVKRLLTREKTPGEYLDSCLGFTAGWSVLQPSALSAVSSLLRQASKALDSFRQAVMSDPDLPEAHYNLGLALAQTGSLRESIHEFNEAISVNPLYLEARINLGLVLSQNSDPAGAANVYREILKQNPTRAEIHNNLGLVLVQMKDSKAEVAFMEALRLKPDYAEAHYNLALALLQSGRKEESNSEFEKAYQLAPHLRTTATAPPHSSRTPSKD